MEELHHRLFNNKIRKLQLSTLFAFYEMSECQTPLFHSWVQADVMITRSLELVLATLHITA